MSLLLSHLIMELNQLDNRLLNLGLNLLQFGELFLIGIVLLTRYGVGRIVGTSHDTTSLRLLLVSV